MTQILVLIQKLNFKRVQLRKQEHAMTIAALFCIIAIQMLPETIASMIMIFPVRYFTTIAKISKFESQWNIKSEASSFSKIVHWVADRKHIQLNEDACAGMILEIWILLLWQGTIKSFLKRWFQCEQFHRFFVFFSLTDSIHQISPGYKKWIWVGDLGFELGALW